MNVWTALIEWLKESGSTIFSFIQTFRLDKRTQQLKEAKFEIVTQEKTAQAYKEAMEDQKRVEEARIEAETLNKEFQESQDALTKTQRRTGKLNTSDRLDNLR